MEQEGRNNMIVGVITLIILGLIIGRTVDLQINRQYPIKQARANVKQAMSTSDLNRVILYLDSSLVHIESFDGNDAWWLPTNTTDWQGVKDDIISVRDTCQAFIDNNISIQDYGYQQFIHNLEDTLPAIDLRLENIQYTRTATYFWWSIGFWIIFLGTIVWWVYWFDWF